MRPMTISEMEVAEIEANLFPAARPIVRGRPEFPWHRDRTGKVTASQRASSQAFAVDFFATIGALPSRDAILAAWTDHLALSLGGPWTIDMEHLVPRDFLGELRPTQVDAVARGGAGIILFE